MKVEFIPDLVTCCCILHNMILGMPAPNIDYLCAVLEEEARLDALEPRRLGARQRVFGREAQHQQPRGKMGEESNNGPMWWLTWGDYPSGCSQVYFEEDSHVQEIGHDYGVRHHTIGGCMHEINYVWEAEDLLCVPLLRGTGGGRLGTAVGSECGEMIRGAGRCNAVSGETGSPQLD